ncbi:MAG TPA: PH domain-containing protein [Planctomycetes bacterium]|nr:PH domain-containing protein [Planctomycetota bacterium]
MSTGDAFPQLQETTTMVIWPTVGANRLGRFVGRMCAVGGGSGRFLTWGKLFAILAIPLALAAFVWNLLPYVARRYRLTNRRLVVHRAYSGQEERSLALDGFDEIHIERLPGQAWLRSGDLVFRHEGHEVFRLSGVSRPEVFQHIVLEVRQAYLSVRQVLRQQEPASGAA